MITNAWISIDDFNLNATGGQEFLILGREMNWRDKKVNQSNPLEIFCFEGMFRDAFCQGSPLHSDRTLIVKPYYFMLLEPPNGE